MKKMSLSDWESEFVPVRNHIDKNAASEGYLFETYGPEIDFVMSIKESNPDRVWTMIDHEPEPYIINGLVEAGCYEDRFSIIGHFVTEKSAKKNTKYKIIQESDFFWVLPTWYCMGEMVTQKQKGG